MPMNDDFAARIIANDLDSINMRIEALPGSHCRGRGFLIVSALTDDNCESAIPYHGGRDVR